MCISLISINNDGHITIVFKNQNKFIFKKEDFKISKLPNNQGLIFTKNNKTFTVKMTNQDLDFIIKKYNYCEN